MRENPQNVNRHKEPSPQTREDADLQMIRAVILDRRFSDEQVLDICRKITAPYVGEAVETVQ